MRSANSKIGMHNNLYRSPPVDGFGHPPYACYGAGPHRPKQRQATPAWHQAITL